MNLIIIKGITVFIVTDEAFDEIEERRRNKEGVCDILAMHSLETVDLQITNNKKVYWPSYTINNIMYLDNPQGIPMGVGFLLAL